MIPGELLPASGEIELNAGRRATRLTVANTGDRPIQVGSHFHFFEANAALRFDRAAARGCRLDIAAGTAVRFEPGQEREISLIALAGDRIVYGFNAAVMGPLDGTKPLKSRVKGKSGAAAKTRPQVPGSAAKKRPAKTAAKSAAKKSRGGRR